jgi:hypothetical protein
MKTIQILVDITIDETQHTPSAVVQAVDDILTAHEWGVECRELLTCPECGCNDIEERHTVATFRIPEVDFFRM